MSEARSRTRGAVRAFTLIELLVTISIIAILVAIILPTLASTFATARNFKCVKAQRDVAVDFELFASDSLQPFRGNDFAEVGEGFFRLETFLESQYGIDEFWRYGTAPQITLPQGTPLDPMRCSEVEGDLEFVARRPCSRGGIRSFESVSYGFNVRFHIARRGGSVRTGVALNRATMADFPGQTPFYHDVDGAVARVKGVSPVFSGPVSHDRALISNDKFWFPALRHAGAMNVSFVDGHVESTKTPLAETNWMWETHPTP